MEGTQISRSYKEEVFGVGGMDTREITFTQRDNGLFTFSTGKIKLFFQKNENNTLEPKKGCASTSRFSGFDDYRVDCILALVGYVAKRDKLEIPNGIKSRVDGAKGLGVSPLWTTEDFLMKFGSKQDMVGYFQSANKNKGNFSTRDLTVPFRMVGLNFDTFLFDPEPVSSIPRRDKMTRSTNVGYAAMGSVLSLAKFVAKRDGLKLIYPPKYFDESTVARFKPLELEGMAIASVMRK